MKMESIMMWAGALFSQENHPASQLIRQKPVNVILKCQQSSLDSYWWKQLMSEAWNNFFDTFLKEKLLEKTND